MCRFVILLVVVKRLGLFVMDFILLLVWFVLLDVCYNGLVDFLVICFFCD